MYAGKVIESQQGIPVLFQTLHCFRILVLIAPQEDIKGMFGILACLSHPDLMKFCFGPGLHSFREFVEHIGGLVNPAALVSRLTIDLGQGLPEAQRPITNGDLWPCLQASGLQLLQELQPTCLRLTVSIYDESEGLWTDAKTTPQGYDLSACTAGGGERTAVDIHEPRAREDERHAPHFSSNLPNGFMGRAQSSLPHKWQGRSEAYPRLYAQE